MSNVTRLHMRCVPCVTGVCIMRMCWGCHTGVCSVSRVRYLQTLFGRESSVLCGRGISLTLTAYMIILTSTINCMWHWRKHQVYLQDDAASVQHYFLVCVTPQGSWCSYSRVYMHLRWRADMSYRRKVISHTYMLMLQEKYFIMCGL